MKMILAATFAFLTGLGGVSAQPVRAEQAVEAGMLNGRAVNFPKPQYPESARLAHIGGIVAVKVIVDGSGAVISATADIYDQHQRTNADGTKAEPVALDQSLRDAAEAAARQAIFPPFFLKGRPANISGHLMYNFVADNSNQPPRVGDMWGPLLNRQAIELPQPVYPSDAAPKPVVETVIVSIKIDENGNVVSATAIGGPAYLHPAAEQAAMKAKFRPRLLAGEPISNWGLIQYDFPAAKKKIE